MFAPDGGFAGVGAAGVGAGAAFGSGAGGCHSRGAVALVHGMSMRCSLRQRELII